MKLFCSPADSISAAPPLSHLAVAPAASVPLQKWSQVQRTSLPPQTNTEKQARRRDRQMPSMQETR